MSNFKDNKTELTNKFIRNGTAVDVIEDDVNPANNQPLPVKLTGVTGDINITAGDLNVSINQNTDSVEIFGNDGTTNRAVKTDTAGNLNVNVISTVGATAFGVATNTRVTLTALAPTLVLASNVNRKFSNISNSSGSLVTIQLGTSTGLTSTQIGIAIPSGTFYELKGDNLFTGNVYAYTVSGTVTLSVVEGTP